MSRLIFSSMLGLALAICLVAGTLAWHVVTLPASTITTGVPNPSLGYAFYSALDQLLASGDRSELDSLVSGDFVDHPVGSTAEHSVDDLVEQLTSFGAAFPDTRLTVLDIATTVDGLVASIEPIDLADIRVAGLSLHSHSAPGGYEVLHIRNGKVTERWSIELPGVPAAAFPGAVFSMDGTINIGVRLDRIRLNGDRAFQWQLGGPAILMVESGTVQRDVVYDDAHMQSHHEMDRLDAGSATLLAAGARIQLRRAGDAPAVALLYSTHQRAQTDNHPAEEPTGAPSLRLRSSFLPLLQQGRWRMSVTKLNLNDGNTIGLDVPSGAELLLCSTGSRIAATAEHGTITTLDKDSGVIKRPDADTIAAGAAATISGATRVTLQATAADAGSVWVITMIPEGTPGISAGPKVE